MDITNKKQLVTMLKQQISTSDRQALKALVTVYKNQTATEKAAKQTQVWNNVGFSGIDANILSSIASYYLTWNKVSDKQLAIVKRLMPRYANQLVNQSLESGKIKKEGGKYIW